MATLRAVFPAWGEGDSFALEGGPDWHMLTPVRGDIALIALRDTDLAAGGDEEVALLVMNRFVTPEGGMGLEVKSIGGSTPEVTRQFSTWFNRKQGVLHLCSSTPCTYTEDHFLHAVRVRFFTRGGFEASFYGAPQKRQVAKWLGEGEKVVEDAEAVESEEAAEREPSSGDAGRKEKGKGDASTRSSRPGARLGALRRPKTTAKGTRPDPPPPEEPPLKRRKHGIEQEGIEEDLTLESSAGIGGEKADDLREKLDALRERLGAKPRRRVSFSEDANVEEESGGALQDGAKPSSSVPARPSLSTGTSLKRTRTELGGTRDSTLKSVSAQLAHQAQVATGQKDGRSRGGDEELMELLNRAISERSSAGAAAGGKAPSDGDEGKKKKKKRGKKKERKKKDKGKKRKRKLVNGVIVSTSSSGSSSSESSGSDTNEFEAPLRRRSKASPGSVLRLLVQKAQTALDQSALIEGTAGGDAIVGGVKLVTYFQLQIKATFGHARGPMRDLALMATTLDLLRAGHIARAADALAGHFLACHQSLHDGSWSQARFLEVVDDADQAATSASILLETRRHAKATMKVEAPEWLPWRGRPWQGGEGRGKGWWSSDKGKGKNKKGKSKDKEKGDRHKEGKGKAGWKDLQDKGEKES